MSVNTLFLITGKTEKSAGFKSMLGPDFSYFIIEIRYCWTFFPFEPPMTTWLTSTQASIESTLLKVKYNDIYIRCFLRWHGSTNALILSFVRPCCSLSLTHSKTLGCSQFTCSYFDIFDPSLFLLNDHFYSKYQWILVILFCQTEIVLKDSIAFVYVTKSEKSSH